MTIIGAPTDAFDTLPIDNSAGLPQSFPYLRDGVRYQFALYVNAPDTALGPIDGLMKLPDATRYLVVRVDTVAADGTRQTLLLRKVVPSLLYQAGRLLLAFPTQIVARRNLNGAGNFGTNIVGRAS
jgi:hypothetical protein